VSFYFVLAIVTLPQVLFGWSRFNHVLSSPARQFTRGTEMNVIEPQLLIALGTLAGGVAALIEALRPLFRGDKLRRRS